MRNFEWKQFHSYRVFDEFLEKFLISRKSYVTRHDQTLNLTAAFEDIRAKFVGGYDKSKRDFETKVSQQFLNAEVETKIVFSNVEYLWAMPVANINPNTKRGYAERWFSSNKEIVSGGEYFFCDPQSIADPGPWYLRNKYNEIVSILRVLSLLYADSSVVNLDTAKKRIVEICYKAIYEGVDKSDIFSASVKCGVYSALLHLADPDRFESIISAAHKDRITAVFQGVIEDRPEIKCREQKLKLIRERLYTEYEHHAEEYPFRKYRWFFYSDAVKPLWIDKTRKYEQIDTSIADQIYIEQEVGDDSETEGEKTTVRLQKVKRSARLINKVKKADRYRCRACGFQFQQQIVHVHHLDPLSERESPSETKPEDLVTLCPNCHYIAHYLLRQDSKFKERSVLLTELKKLTANLTSKIS